MLEATCERSNLLAGLQAAGKAVSGRSTLPILNNVLIEGNGQGSLRITGTDLELCVEAEVPAKVTKKGSITVPARIGADLVKRFPAKVPITVTEGTEQTQKGDKLIEEASGMVAFVAEATRYNVRSIPAEEWSTLPQVEGEALTVPIPELIATMKRVVFAASPDETRPMLTGVLCKVGDGKLTLTATDTHRLAQTAIDVRKQKEVCFLVPAKALLTVAHLWAKGEGTATLTVGERLCEFRAEGLPTISSRLIEGDFPNYQKVIPTDFDRQVTVAADNVARLREALARALIVAEEDACRVVFDLKKKDSSITAEAPDVGSGLEEPIPCKFDGAPLEIAFNGRYLADALPVTEGDVTLELNGALMPGKLTDSADSSWLYVLMPMQIA